MSRREVKNGKDQISFISSKGQNSIQIMAEELKQKASHQKLVEGFLTTNLPFKPGSKQKFAMGKLDFTSGSFYQITKEAQLPAILLLQIIQSSFKSIVDSLTK